MSEICSENSETFDVWRTLAATGIKDYMNRVTYASQVMRPWGPLLPCTPQMLPSKYCQRWPTKLEKGRFLVCGQGGTAPVTPINPYLGGNVQKKWATF